MHLEKLKWLIFWNGGSSNIYSGTLPLPYFSWCLNMFHVQEVKCFAQPQISHRFSRLWQYHMLFEYQLQQWFPRTEILPTTCSCHTSTACIVSVLELHNCITTIVPFFSWCRHRTGCNYRGLSMYLDGGSKWIETVSIHFDPCLITILYARQEYSPWMWRTISGLVRLGGKAQTEIGWAGNAALTSMEQCLLAETVPPSHPPIHP